VAKKAGVSGESLGKLKIKENPGTLVERGRRLKKKETETILKSDRNHGGQKG